MKVGRPTAKDEMWIDAAIEGIFNTDKPLRFKDLERAAEVIGISTPTLNSHVHELTEKGIVLKEGKQYRKNPLLKHRITIADEFPVLGPVNSQDDDDFTHRESLFGVESEMVGILETGVLVRKLQSDIKTSYDQFVSRLLGSQDFKTIWGQRPEKWNPAKFSIRQCLEIDFQAIMVATLNLLYAVWKTENSAIACEIARLRFERELMIWYAKLARDCWANRKQFSMSDLHNLELKYKIHHRPSDPKPL